MDTASTNSSLLHTDEDMQVEDKIDQLQEQIDDNIAKTQQFRIGQTSHKIMDSVSQQIFETSGPVKKREKSSDCMSCKVVTFQKEKHINWCQFCGQSVCKDCFFKSRPFPKAMLGKDGEQIRGDICKLCDRRFLVRQMLMDVQSNSAKKNS